MFLIRKKKEKKKQFIKYEDGRFVPIDAEAYSISSSSFQTKPFLKPNWMNGLMWQIVKWLIFILFFGFFMYSLYDIYQNFFASPTGSTTSYLPASQEKKSADSFSENYRTNIHSLPSLSTSKSQNVHEALQIANNINNQFVDTVSMEIQYIQNYTRQKANRINLTQKLENNLVFKESLLSSLQQKESLFKESNPLFELYQTIEKRLASSIDFSEKILLAIHSYDNEQLSIITDEYVLQDNQLRQEEIDSMIQTLDYYHIPYKMDEEYKVIQFHLPSS